MTASRLAAIVLGSLTVAVTLRSAMRTFILPRSARDEITRAVFLASRVLFDVRMRFSRDYAGRDQVMAFYAPFTILALMACWVALVIVGYAAIYWGLGDDAWRAVYVSGSTLLTLGFEKPEGRAAMLVSFTEGGIGLALVALLVAYLPAIYTAFARRESMVTLLEIRAGAPPHAVELLIRTHQLGGMEQIDVLWAEWQHWFAELEESHTSQGALSFFRSPQPQRSWVTAAGAVLDAVGLAGAALRRGPSAQERLTLRAGVFALRRIAEFFALPFEREPDPRGPVSVRRHEFEDAYRRLVDAELDVCTDLEQAWADFVAARAQYDEVLLALAALTMAPEAPWSGDRAQRLESRVEIGGRPQVDPLAGPVPTTRADVARAVPRTAPRTPDPTALDGGLEPQPVPDAAPTAAPAGVDRGRETRPPHR
jgi:hypothetical protein